MIKLALAEKRMLQPIDGHGVAHFLARDLETKAIVDLARAPREQWHVVHPSDVPPAEQYTLTVDPTEIVGIEELWRGRGGLWQVVMISFRRGAPAIIYDPQIGLVEEVVRRAKSGKVEPSACLPAAWRERAIPNAELCADGKRTP